LKNCLTIDLESIAHRYLTERKSLSGEIRDRILSEEGRRAIDGGALPRNTRNMLDILSRYGHTATFFIVGELHSWYPELIQEIAERGHEVAYHSHTHQLLQTIDSLRTSIQQSEDFIRSHRPRGFRAPRAKITREFLAELSRQGFVYDSSSYGPLDISQKIDGVIEIPISTHSFLGKKPSLTLPRHLSLDLLLKLEIPFGSGYFISLMSAVSPNLIGYFIEKSNRKGYPSVLCIHPWQLSRETSGKVSSMNLARLGYLPYDISCYRAFEYLVENYRFFSMSELIEDMGIF